MGPFPLLALLLPLPGLQDGPGAGVEGLLATLEERTAARRRAARQAWAELGPAWRENPGEETAAPLLPFAPEIQDPLLEELFAQGTGPATRAALLDLLGRVLDPVGALRLARRLDELPADLLPAAFRAVGERGSAEALELLEPWLTRGPNDARQTALDVLLRRGDPSRARAWLEAAPLEALDLATLSTSLQALAARDLPEDFRLPPGFEQPRETDLVPGILAILESRLDEASEDFLLEVALESPNPPEIRAQALRLLEEGVRRFRWHETEKRLRAFLADRPEDPMATAVAWSLHRLGERQGTRFLLEGPLAAVKARPRNARSWLRLGRLQVQLGLHQDAWRSYRQGLDLVLGTPAQRTLTDEDWVFAARAAAGARRYRDAAAWLEASRLSPRELAPYRDLPEFASVLRRQPFRRIFGLD